METYVLICKSMASAAVVGTTVFCCCLVVMGGDEREVWRIPVCIAAGIAVVTGLWI